MCYTLPIMIIGERLKELRESKKLSQGDIEKRTGLLRCYTSRVENGHTVPNIETLERYARALEIPLYRLFYEGEEPRKLPSLLKHETRDVGSWGSSGKDALILRRLRKLLMRTKERDCRLLLFTAQRMAHRRRSRSGA